MTHSGDPGEPSAASPGPADPEPGSPPGSASVPPGYPPAIPPANPPAIPPANPPAYPPPGYAPPAYQPYAYAAPRRGTPGMLIATGVVLLVLAVLALLWALLFALYGALIGSIGSAIESNPGAFDFSTGDFQGMFDAMRPVLFGLAAFALLVALAHGAAGIGVIGRRAWARITGLVLGGLGLALNVLGIVVTLLGFGSAEPVIRNGITVDPVPSLVLVVVVLTVFAAAYGFVVVALARRGADFG